MNYTISFNQPCALAVGLDLQECVIVCGIASMFASSSIQEYVHDDICYKWIAPSKLLADLPILKFKKRSMMDKIKSLEDKGIIQRCPENQKLGKSFYRAGDKWDLLFYKQPMQENAYPYAENCTPPMQENAYPPMQENAHYTNTINPDINNTNIKDSSALDFFEKEIWGNYGKHGNKQSALKAFQQIPKKDYAEVRAGIEKYVDWLKAKGDYKTHFQKHLSTYLNRKCWQDELPAITSRPSSFAKNGKLQMPDWGKGLGAIDATDDVAF